MLRFMPFLILSVCVSCAAVLPAARVLAGNSAYSRGLYQKAILRYLEEDSERDRVLYNLANVYYSLGEGRAALASWSRAEKDTEDKEVLYRIFFNRGVLYYQWGRYEEAYRSFRWVLGFKPSSLDAKANLELSLARARVVEGSVSPERPEKEDDLDEGSLRLLDYVKRKELDTWSTEESPPSAAEDW